MNEKKVGRPAGVKNKPKEATVTQAILSMDKEPNVDWLSLVMELQSALAKAYVDIQRLEKETIDFPFTEAVVKERDKIKQSYIDSLEWSLAELTVRGRDDEDVEF